MLPVPGLLQPHPALPRHHDRWLLPERGVLPDEVCGRVGGDLEHMRRGTGEAVGLGGGARAAAGRGSGLDVVDAG